MFPDGKESRGQSVKAAQKVAAASTCPEDKGDWRNPKGLSGISLFSLALAAACNFHQHNHFGAVIHVFFFSFPDEKEEGRETRA